MLLALLPLILVLSCAIALDSPGGVFFRQRRIGRFGRPFTILKFRTMSAAAPRFSLKVAESDPRITRVGRVLRRSGLDELPQLWNVIRGEMALIGPRPEQEALMSRYEPWQHERHVVKPGITGWWQIHHRDSDPMDLNVDKDIHYVRSQSLALDLQILAGTVKVLLNVFRRRSARTGVRPRRRREFDGGDGFVLVEEPAAD